MAFAVYVPRKSGNWDNYWQKSDFKRELYLCETDGLLPIFAKYLKKKQKILEAGCGLGKWVVYLSRLGFDIVGVDTNEYAIKQLRKNFPKVKARLGDVNRLPFSAGSFDVYISLGVVEHFQSGPQKAIAEAYQVLKPGGLAIIEVPYDNTQRQILRLFSALSGLLKKPAKVLLTSLGLRQERKVTDRIFYEYHYTRPELEKFVKAAGFKIKGWFAKDDLSDENSIGLWLDFPRLRKEINQADFKLTAWGRALKKVYSLLGLTKIYSACEVCVARKPK